MVRGGGGEGGEGEGGGGGMVGVWRRMLREGRVGGW